jgi:predicted acetyltransferase
MIQSIIRGLLMPAKIRWTSKQQSTFKYLLSRVPLRAEQYDRGMKVRPVNVTQFKELCDQNGLGECSEVKRVIQTLQTMPGEFIKFERRV